MSHKTLPMVTVITVCFNSESSISRSIASVNLQSYKNIEHIFIDGASTDKTLEIIKKSSNRNSRIISEPDCGIYCAMNKGLKLAQGDFIVFLNSDDEFYNPQVLSDMVTNIDRSSALICYGNVRYFREGYPFNGREFRASQQSAESLFPHWIPPHPSFMIHRQILEKVGFFNTDYKLASDFDYIRRCLLIADNRIYHLDKCLVKMQLGGATNVSLKNIVKQNLEIISIISSASQFKNFWTISIFIIGKGFFRSLNALSRFKRNFDG